MEKKIAKKGAIDGLISPSFSTIKDLLKKYIDAGGKIAIYPACAKTHDVTEENVVENALLMAAAVQEIAIDRQIMSF